MSFMEQLNNYRLIKNALTAKTIARAIVNRLARAEAAGKRIYPEIKYLVRRYQIPELAKSRSRLAKTPIIPGTGPARRVKPFVSLVNVMTRIPRRRPVVGPREIRRVPLRRPKPGRTIPRIRLPISVDRFIQEFAKVFRVT